MPGPLFTPGQAFVVRLLLGGLVGTPVALVLLGMAWVRSDYWTGRNTEHEQPVMFDHRHHVVDDGIDCRYCHWPAFQGAYAGVPPTAVCMNCHSQIWSGQPMLAPVRASWKSGTPLVWTRVNRLPQYVFFDHSAHVLRGVGCETCHGRVDEMANVHPTQPLTMQWCIDCHRHPEAAERPQDAITVMGWTPSPQTPSGAALVQARAISPPLSCSGCHR